ncbi:MAG TPA: chemotaxis protein CheB [Chryseosolibacter sp.]
METHDFFIVGVGASAGGQQALKEFFSTVPAETDAAFVVVTHLFREHKSELASIISRFTKLNVVSIKNNTRISPGNIYVMPEDVFVHLQGHVLKLVPRPNDNLINNSINIFFESLAKEAGTKAIGVILSGMGSDGSDGALKIFMEGGDVLVQDPESTKFNSMPMATILKDHPDFILPPRELGNKVAEMVRSKSAKREARIYKHDDLRLNPS